MACVSPYNLKSAFIGYGDKNIYRSHNGLRAWWKLNVSTSNASYVEDWSGYGMTGSWTTAAGADIKHYQPYWWAQAPSRYIQTKSFGFISGAADGSATGGSIGIGSSTDWDPIIGNAAGSSQKFTLGARVYYNSGALSVEHVDGAMSKPEIYPRIFDFSNDLQLYVDRSTWRYVFVAKFDSAAVYWATDTGSVTSDTWQHVMATFDASQTTNPPIFYINGVSASFSHYGGTFAGSYYGIATTANCYIGNTPDNNRSWSGSISDVAVWDSVLEPEEAAAWYQAARGPKETRKNLFDFGPGSDNSNKYPGFHKVHRNNRPRIKIKSLSYEPLYPGLWRSRWLRAYQHDRRLLDCRRWWV